ncbi:hypothetical protein APR50_24830 [Variovorax paradoxus]|jgi:lipid A ethanolaminephosphotransferase|nr:hypothetical protein APR52_34505 [Variovorax paradoxus]KPV03421.1 hypothetical protein APR50_24830 [Variovorax paradoxus]KPV04704.1 hypothetical protein APR49_23665 [Variovorax paradoxus]KPV19214.1 hypothetical protein APR51_21080 [Variovorax paradoxus]KPV30226.1 hypothetical protein APR48_20515 [Variovorax paradoxus]
MDVAVIYVSDHGERNIYLHGLPRLLAPSEQTHVSMLAWLSRETQDRLKVPAHCLQSVTQDTYSHDNLFPTLFGFLGVVPTACRGSLDLLECARTS